MRKLIAIAFSIALAACPGPEKQDAAAADAAIADAAIADMAIADMAIADAVLTDSTPVDAAIPDSALSDTGRPQTCQGEPCLTAVADETDWAVISAASTLGRCDIDQESKYLAPATPGAELQEIVFQDVKQHALHIDFMRDVLNDYFAGLPVEDYYRLVQRRATRQYWAGSLFRMVQNSTVVGYAFDVITDPAVPSEELSQQEVEAIRALLSTRFRLPLGYAPISDRAIAAARTFADVPFPVYLPVICPTGRCPTADSNCISVPAHTEVCGHFIDGRAIQLEHQHKARLSLFEGVFDLPRTASTVELTVFGGGEYGPARTAIEYATPGSLAATPGSGWISYHYQQTLRAGSDTIYLDWYFNMAATGGVLTLAEPELSQGYGMSGYVNEPIWPDTQIHLSSCGYEAFPLLHGSATFGDGGSLGFDYRYQLTMAGSGSFELMAATVQLAANPATAIDDYFRLVYAGEHHNWNNQLWFLFETPQTYNNHPVYGVWVDEAAYSCCPPDGIYTMDADRRKLDPLPVTSYLRPNPTP
ncbi:MAG: hypothetical protein JXR83_00620 [Deltaproteobacteria bacterium]|nr:hypothetical protein [Deltaproteobacteria bacterium]